MELLWDFYPLDNLTIVSESKTTGEMVIRGVFGRANEVNNNKRYYAKTILEREVVKLQPMIAEKRLLGELEHPERANVSLSNASHMVTKLNWQGDVLMGEAKLLNTPAGKIAQQLIKDGVTLGISSRGLGTLKESVNRPGVLEVNENYKMVTFDLVAEPSTRGAFPTLVNESTQLLLEKTKKEVAAQNLVLRLFESRVSEVRESQIAKLFKPRLNENAEKLKDVKLATNLAKGINKQGGITKSKGGKPLVDVASSAIGKKAKDKSFTFRALGDLLKTRKK